MDATLGSLHGSSQHGKTTFAKQLYEAPEGPATVLLECLARLSNQETVSPDSLDSAGRLGLHRATLTGRTVRIKVGKL